MKSLLTEFFALREKDEDDPFAGQKTSVQAQVPRGELPTGQTAIAGSHNAPSGMFKTKPQMQPPRSTPGSGPPPSKKVDPATEFLRSKGALGGIVGPGSGVAPKAAQQQQARQGGSSSPSSPQKAQAPITKPNYKGSYVGQSVNTGGQFKHKPVAWTDKGTGDKKYGQVQSKVDQRAVWNGKDWVSQAEYQRNPGGKTESLSLREFFIFESKCPSCGRDGAYVGLNDVECPNPECKNHKGQDSSGDEEAIAKQLLSIIKKNDRQALDKLISSPKYKELVKTYEATGDDIFGEVIYYADRDEYEEIWSNDMLHRAIKDTFEPGQPWSSAF